MGVNRIAVVPGDHGMDRITYLHLKLSLSLSLYRDNSLRRLTWQKGAGITAATGRLSGLRTLYAT